MSYHVEKHRLRLCERYFSTDMKKVLIEAVEDAAGRAKSKEAYNNPSSTIHIFTDEIIAIKR